MSPSWQYSKQKKKRLCI